MVSGSVDSGCHRLSENIWFIWLNMVYKSEKMRCHACGRMDRRTHKHVKVGQYYDLAESRIYAICNTCPSAPMFLRPANAIFKNGNL